MQGAVILAVGLLFCWLAWTGWRNWNIDQISLIETAILKIDDAEPLPLTRVDRGLQKFQLTMFTIFGPLGLLLGILLLLS